MLITLAIFGTYLLFLLFWMSTPFSGEVWWLDITLGPILAFLGMAITIAVLGLMFWGPLYLITSFK